MRVIPEVNTPSNRTGLPMKLCFRTAVPLVALAITGALATLAFVPSSSSTSSATLASAFPIVEAQFAR